VERFLRSRGDSVKKAAKHLRTVLSWRETVGAGTPGGALLPPFPSIPIRPELLPCSPPSRARPSFHLFWKSAGGWDVNKRKLASINASLRCDALLEPPPCGLLALFLQPIPTAQCISSQATVAAARNLLLCLCRFRFIPRSIFKVQSRNSAILWCYYVRMIVRLLVESANGA
jgi:hypothetical protein